MCIWINWASHHSADSDSVPLINTRFILPSGDLSAPLREGGKTLDDNYSQIRKILLLAHHLFSWRMGVASSVRWESQAKKKNLRICFGQEYSSGYWSQELISEKWIFFSWSNEFTKCCITLTLWRPKIYRAKALRTHPVEKLVWFSVAPSPLPIELHLAAEIFFPNIYLFGCIRP